MRKTNPVKIPKYPVTIRQIGEKEKQVFRNARNFKYIEYTFEFIVTYFICNVVNQKKRNEIKTGRGIVKWNTLKAVTPVEYVRWNVFLDQFNLFDEFREL